VDTFREAKEHRPSLLQQARIKSPRHKWLVGRFDGKKVHRTFFYFRLTPPSEEKSFAFSLKGL
jgi:hypothetical protein